MRTEPLIEWDLSPVMPKETPARQGVGKSSGQATTDSNRTIAPNQSQLNYSPEAELAVIGAAIALPEASDGLAGVELGWFVEPAHRHIWQSIQRCKRPGIVDVCDELLKAGHDVDVPMVHHAIDCAPVTTSDARYHVEKLRALFILRELRGVGLKLVEADSGCDPGLMIANTVLRLEKLTANRSVIRSVRASEYLEKEPPLTDQVVTDFWDICDKLALIAPSKSRKSFWTLQMIIALTTGTDFYGLGVKRPRKVYLVNLEIRGGQFHRRLWRMVRRLGADKKLVGQNLVVVNVRDLSGSCITIDEIKIESLRFGAEVIVIDPMYKLHLGDENSAKDMKPLMASFDAMCEATGAAIMYVHHDAKGASGDRNIRDRGAGSNVVGRDYDAAITLSPHRHEKDALVLEFMCRNYAPRPEIVLRWVDGAFERAGDLFAIKETANTGRGGKVTNPLTVDADSAVDLIRIKPLPSTEFRTTLREKLGMTESRARDVIRYVIEAGLLTKHSEPLQPGNPMIYSLPAHSGVENDTNRPAVTKTDSQMQF